jgi:Pyruvate/2-oxoacid:ferredoxin oxidoreductase delta subunit
VHYREAVFYFYTGTGNTFRVATWMADAAREAGADVTVRSIAAAQPVQEIGTGEDVLLGLVMPTHGFTAPLPVLRFALRLPRRSNTDAVVLATRAIFEGSATLLIAVILFLKGYRIRGAAGLDMPSNWIAMHPAFSADAVTRIMAGARLRVVAIADVVLSGERYFAGRMVFLLGLLILPLSLGYMLVGRFFLGKLFFASDRCTGCGSCAAHCPNQAITLRGSEGHWRPYWTFHCESCMRCMAFCPNQAVEASHLLGVGAYFLAGAIPVTVILFWLTARIPVLAFLEEVPRQILRSAINIAAIGIVYPLFYFLLRVEWIRRLFAAATLTRYYRRYHAPDIQLEELS